MNDLFGPVPVAPVKPILPGRRHRFALLSHPPQHPPAPPPTDEVRDLSHRRAHALTRVRTNGGFDKGYPGRVVALPASSITAKGVVALARLAWKYRRQMPPDLVPLREP